MLGHSLLKHAPHAFRWLDGDDFRRREGQRQSVSPPARADGEPRLAGSRKRAQNVGRRLVRAAWVRAKVGGDGCIEVSGRRAFTETLGLLAIGADPLAPGPDRTRGGKAKDIGHALRLDRRGRATGSEASGPGPFA